MPAKGAIAPHAGYLYSGACAAQVFAQIEWPPIVVVLAPNHTGRGKARVSTWDQGSFETPLGDLVVAERFLARLEQECAFIVNDHEAHHTEHAVEVELPFLAHLAPHVSIVPLVLNSVDWDFCQKLVRSLVTVIREWPENVMLLASSDMTHYQSANEAAERDAMALKCMEALDGKRMLDTCDRESVSMCGRFPAAVVLEAARELGATMGEVVDYRHSGMVTGDNEQVVAYAGVILR